MRFIAIILSILFNYSALSIAAECTEGLSGLNLKQKVRMYAKEFGQFVTIEVTGAEADKIIYKKLTEYIRENSYIFSLGKRTTVFNRLNNAVKPSSGSMDSQIRILADALISEQSRLDTRDVSDIVGEVLPYAQARVSMSPEFYKMALSLAEQNYFKKSDMSDYRKMSKAVRETVGYFWLGP